METDKQRLVPRKEDGEGVNERTFFVSKIMLLMQPTVTEELQAMGRTDDTEFCLEVDLLLRKLVGRFYDMGQKEATMYMPMITAYLKRMKS